MSHREGRIVHDADSHIIESRGWLEGYASDYVREHLDTGVFDLNMSALDPLMDAADKRLAGGKPELTEALKADIFAHKGKRNMWGAYGAIEKTERSDALSHMGVTSQLIFPSVGFGRFAFSKDMEVVYGGCDALNRGMADFCADDERLKSVGYLSLREPDRAVKSLKLALELGINTIWIGSDAMGGRAPSHIAYDPLWAMMQEAGVPVTLHIGSGRNMTSVYMNTGVERVLAGNLNIETTKPKDMPVIHHSIERWLTCMIYDGVLERFPNLKVGIIELGANWLPASLMNLDMGVTLLGRFDTALQELSLKPSEYVQRQVRVAPLHTENTGWILRNVPEEILMFNTDYPHPEGGRDPFGDFERSLDAVDATEHELDRFYTKNYEDFLGL